MIDPMFPASSDIIGLNRSQTVQTNAPTSPPASTEDLQSVMVTAFDELKKSVGGGEFIEDSPIGASLDDSIIPTLESIDTRLGEIQTWIHEWTMPETGTVSSSIDEVSTDTIVTELQNLKDSFHTVFNPDMLRLSVREGVTEGMLRFLTFFQRGSSGGVPVGVGTSTGSTGSVTSTSLTHAPLNLPVPYDSSNTASSVNNLSLPSSGFDFRRSQAGAYGDIANQGDFSYKVLSGQELPTSEGQVRDSRSLIKSGDKNVIDVGLASDVESERVEDNDRAERKATALEALVAKLDNLRGGDAGDASLQPATMGNPLKALGLFMAVGALDHLIRFLGQDGGLMGFASNVLDNLLGIGIATLVGGVVGGIIGAKFGMPLLGAKLGAAIVGGGYAFLTGMGLVDSPGSVMSPIKTMQSEEASTPEKVSAGGELVSTVSKYGQIAGIGTAVLGGLAFLGGLALSATGVGAAGGVPLKVAGVGLMKKGALTWAASRTAQYVGDGTQYVANQFIPDDNLDDGIITSNGTVSSLSSSGKYVITPQGVTQLADDDGIIAAKSLPATGRVTRTIGDGTILPGGNITEDWLREQQALAKDRFLAQYTDTIERYENRNPLRVIGDAIARPFVENFTWEPYYDEHIRRHNFWKHRNNLGRPLTPEEAYRVGSIDGRNYPASDGSLNHTLDYLLMEQALNTLGTGQTIWSPEVIARSGLAEKGSTGDYLARIRRVADMSQEDVERLVREGTRDELRDYMATRQVFDGYRTERLQEAIKTARTALLAAGAATAQMSAFQDTPVGSMFRTPIMAQSRDGSTMVFNRHDMVIPRSSTFGSTPMTTFAGASAQINSYNPSAAAMSRAANMTANDMSQIQNTSAAQAFNMATSHVLSKVNPGGSSLSASQQSNLLANPNIQQQIQAMTLTLLPALLAQNLQAAHATNVNSVAQSNFNAGAHAVSNMTSPVSLASTLTALPASDLARMFPSINLNRPQQEVQRDLEQAIIASQRALTEFEHSLNTVTEAITDLGEVSELVHEDVFGTASHQDVNAVPAENVSSVRPDLRPPYLSPLQRETWDFVGGRLSIPNPFLRAQQQVEANREAQAQAQQAAAAQTRRQEISGNMVNTLLTSMGAMPLTAEELEGLELRSTGLPSGRMKSTTDLEYQNLANKGRASNRVADVYAGARHPNYQTHGVYTANRTYTTEGSNFNRATYSQVAAPVRTAAAVEDEQRINYVMQQNVQPVQTTYASFTGWRQFASGH